MKETYKYLIEICTGTLCHVMGGGELLSIIDELPEKLRKTVLVKGMVCSGHCKDSELKPPFVYVNKELISEATIEKVIRFIEKNEQHDSTK